MSGVLDTSGGEGGPKPLITRWCDAEITLLSPGGRDLHVEKTALSVTMWLPQVVSGPSALASMKEQGADPRES